jgi:hypothetical protein
VHFFVAAPTVAIDAQHPIMYALLQPLSKLPAIIIALLFHIIIIIQALRLNYILGNNRLFPNTNFTTAMCYILFTGLLPAWSNISVALIINIFIIWLIDLLTKLYNTHHSGKAIFDIGLLTGLSILLVPACAPLAIIVLLAILILRAFKVNELFTYIIGCLLPYYFLSAGLYYLDKINLLPSYLPKLTFHLPGFDSEASLFTMAISILTLSFIGFIYLQSNIGKLVIMARKSWIIITILFIFLAPIPFFIKGYNWPITLFVIPAAAALAANLFYYNKNKIFLSILFWLLIFINWFNSFDAIHYLTRASSK